MRPRLCTIWTAVAPEAVLTRRTNDPTPGGYPPSSSRLLVTTLAAGTSANPLVSAICHQRIAPDQHQRYNSGTTSKGTPTRSAARRPSSFVLRRTSVGGRPFATVDLSPRH